MEKLVVAAVQLCAELGDVALNFAKGTELVKQAAAKHAKFVVLPEFFTSAMALSPLMEDVARRDMELGIRQRIVELSTRHSCIIAGSYLSIMSGNVYNTMLVQFPNGEHFVHNKDIPTQFENRYYTDGDHDRAWRGIGVALCWEMLRSQTTLEVPPEVRIVAAGSCWWDVAEESANVEIRHYNHHLNRETPARFAAYLGVPVVHASHVGSVVGFRNGSSNVLVSRNLIGTTQIIDHTGRIQNQLEMSEGDAVLVEEVEIPDASRKRKILPGFWTVNLPQPYLETWNRENRLGREYYQRNRLRMVE